VDLTGESIAALANANDRVLAPSLQILASTAFGNFSLSAFLEALEQHQLSDVQAAPSIQVVDNHNARIQVGEETPIRVLEQGGQTAGATVNVQFKDTGIILDVTPHITNNNQVLLDVSAERSAVQTDLPDVGFNFTTQFGQTRLLLDDGETMVIGGLTLSEVDRNESGIPFLMDIPLLGALFRTTNNTERKQDLIILVTPRIVP
jgi:type IV pilus assembly protein PilQ